MLAVVFTKCFYYMRREKKYIKKNFLNSKEQNLHLRIYFSNKIIRI